MGSVCGKMVSACDHLSPHTSSLCTDVNSLTAVHRLTYERSTPCSTLQNSAGFLPQCWNIGPVSDDFYWIVNFTKN